MKKLNSKKADKENQNLSEEISETEQVKVKKTFTKKQLIVSIVIAVILAVAICITAVCIANDVNPITYSLSVITKDKDKLIGKWQSQDAPGLSAYVFYEDGEYDTYISSFNFSGTYETKGDKLILTNNRSKQEITYQYSVSGSTLTLRLVDDNGEKIKDDETLKFDKVDTLNQKSLADMLGDLKKDAETTAETTTK